jgi:hypothetical protein
MDLNFLMASFFFGTVGMGMLVYGKKAGRILPAGVGLALMVVPYFLPNLIWLLIVCGVLTAVPFVIHE